MIDINHLKSDAKLLAQLSNNNLNSLEGRCTTKHETQDYYFGMLRRQAILCFDLEKILDNRNPQLITTPYILLRSLMDDFLHLLYLELHQDRENEIIKINANTHDQMFQSLKSLTKSNHKFFDGKYPYYLNDLQFEELKNKFSNKEENDKYFISKEKFKFKKFLKLTDLANSISIRRDVDIFKDRAFYLWKEFSSFVHYSNMSFYLESESNIENLQKIDEAFQYCYNSIYLTCKYFERTLNIEFIDNIELNKRHGIIYEC